MLSDGQLGLEPVQRSSTSQGPVTGRHTRLAPTDAQVPSTAAPVATEHAWHAPPHAASQHTPDTQEPLMHSVFAPQLVPFVFCAAQYMPLHQVPVGQPVAQRIGQSGRVPLQVTRTGQAGWPGSPAAAGEQVPMLLLKLQRSQLPEQAESQHTPSTQWPLVHAWLPAQLAPFACVGTHVPLLLQKLPVTHSSEVVQVVGHAPPMPSHAIGAQLGEPALPSASGLQWPSWPGALQTSHGPPHKASQQ